MKKAKPSARKSVGKLAAKKSAPRGMVKRSGRKGSGYPLARPPVGFVTSPGSGRLFVPESRATPVPASKLRAGVKDVKRQIDETLNDLIESLTGNYEIKEIKVVASFSADGKFLGFGVGGAASIEITVCPCE